MSGNPTLRKQTRERIAQLAARQLGANDTEIEQAREAMRKFAAFDPHLTAAPEESAIVAGRRIAQLPWLNGLKVQGGKGGGVVTRARCRQNVVIRVAEVTKFESTLPTRIQISICFVTKYLLPRAAYGAGMEYAL